ncbi:MAG: hypothetical protein AABY64_06615 [Bdellovibrionota bacterium]
MVQLTFYPLNNADTCLIELADGRLMLVDYAHCKVGEDAEEPVVDLRKALEEKLKELNRTHIDIVLFTHADRDHIRNASEFFWFDHAAVYQGPDRIKISELWVPAAFVLETELDECARVIRQEARHRLNLGDGIRVFSTPGLLEGWLVDHGLSVESRQHLISDAGTLVPSFSLTSDGVEFFVHSPFAHRDGDTLQSRNDGSVFLQVVFSVEGQQTSLMLGADSEWEVLKEIVRITNYHNRPERLLWDLFKLPHHCSSGVLATDTPLPINFFLVATSSGLQKIRSLKRLKNLTVFQTYTLLFLIILML